MCLQLTIGPLTEEFEKEVHILDCADALCLEIDRLRGLGWHRPSPLRRFPFRPM
jgi:hypothetical protein